MQNQVAISGKFDKSHGKFFRKWSKICKILGLGVSDLLIILLVIIGVRVKATKPENNTQNARVQANSINNLPWGQMIGFAKAGGRITLAQSATNSFNIHYKWPIK